jgi:acetylornithine deacetylase/succinyl-diaminopimelate desuccinylase-like protein
MERLNTYIQSHIRELHDLLKAMTLIPAPSHFEDAKAEFVRAWLKKNGAEGVYIDSAKNVIFPYGCEGKDDLVVFAAHTDTVFPMDTPLEFRDDGQNFYCPGVGDDTACVAVILMSVKYLLQNKIRPKCGILFVFNACEEGLGNLKGIRQLFSDYAGRICRFYTYDGTYARIVDRCVGSHRYRITAKTKGGHSWGCFGNRNAIQVLAQLVQALYAMPLPKKEGSRTTFNVGTIAGGTSVNTIAQDASMLFEYRSDDPWCIDRMTEQFESTLDAVRKELPDADISVETVGIRPCGRPSDPTVHEEMIHRVIQICEEASGIPCVRGAASTDCNIPLSLGIPAVCCGVYLGGGSHTREEWVNIQSLTTGLEIGARIILDYCENEKTAAE